MPLVGDGVEEDVPGVDAQEHHIPLEEVQVVP